MENYSLVDYGDVIKGVNISSDPEKTFTVLHLEKGNLKVCVDAIFDKISCYQTVKDVTREDLNLYFAWMIALRVWYVNGRSVSAPIRYGHYCVPAFLYIALANLGECYAPDQGLWLVPDVINNRTKEGNIEPFDPTDEQVIRRMRSISNALQTKMEAAGLEFAECLPMARTKGEINLLVFQEKDGGMWAENRVPPLLAGIIAGIFAFKQDPKKMVTMPRVTYGTFNQLIPETYDWITHAKLSPKGQRNGRGNLRPVE